jgi:hypothetical protein
MNVALTRSEVYRLVNDYIGVSGGYLGDFSYKTHYEFYPYYCDVDIDVGEYEPGTTREKFIRILEDVVPLTQAKILRGVFLKYPVSYFPKEEREKKCYWMERIWNMDEKVSIWLLTKGKKNPKVGCTG